MEQENRFIVALKEVWPTIYRWINWIFFSIISFIKNIVRYSIQQFLGK